MSSKTTRVICNSQDPESRPALVLTDAALLEIDSDDAPVLTLTPAAQQALDQERKSARLKRLLHELDQSGDELLAVLDRTRAKWNAYASTHDYEARGDFQDAVIDFFFLVDAIDSLPHPDTKG